MMLRSWAERLMQATCAPEMMTLHVRDTLAAFLAGSATDEGRALSSFYGRNGDATGYAAGAAAIARASECDDIHLPSCVTPGAVVVPVALAFANNRSDADFARAIAAGYAAGLALGAGIGGAKALAASVWPTLLAAPLMAAVTASCLAGHDSERLGHALALALAGASGRLGRPAGTPSGRWFSFAEAVAKGIRASAAADAGFRGDLALVSEPWLAAQAGHADTDLAIFETPPSPPSIAGVGFKPFGIARQGANAVAAFQRVLTSGIDPHRIDTIEISVPPIHAGLLTRPIQAGDRLSRLSNLAYQCACAALAPDVLYDVERRERPDIPLAEFAARVSVSPAKELEAHLPARWAARVTVTASGHRWEETMVAAPFDHDAPRIARLLGEKWRRLLPSRDAGDFFALGENGGAPERAVLWKMIRGRVSMAAGSGRDPEPDQG
jgi:2-methylcitrate dehydratase PrpD